MKKLLIGFIILASSCSMDYMEYLEGSGELQIESSIHQIEIVYKSSKVRDVTVLSHTDGNLYIVSSTGMSRNLEVNDLYNYPTSSMFIAEKSVDDEETVTWDNIQYINTSETTKTQTDSYDTIEAVDAEFTTNNITEEIVGVTKITDQNEMKNHLKGLIGVVDGLNEINGGYMLIEVDPMKLTKVYNKGFDCYLNHLDVLVHPDGSLTYTTGGSIDLSNMEIHVADE